MNEQNENIENTENIENVETEQQEELYRVVEPEVIKMTATQRIAALFTAPTELMKNVKAYPVVLVPFLIVFVLGIISIFPMMPVTDMINEEMANILMERFPEAAVHLTPAGDYYGDFVVPEAFINAVMIVSFAVNAALTPLFTVFITTLGILIISKIMRGKATFVQTFSMYMHVYVITAVGILVVYLLMMLTGSIVDMTSLAAVLPMDVRIDDPLFGVLSGVAVFPIWATIITFIGVKAINEFCNTKAAIVTAIVYLAGIALTVGVLAFSMWVVNATWGAM